MIWDHSIQICQVISKLLICCFLEVPDKHRQALLVSHNWRVYLIISWKITKIHILSLCSLLIAFKILLEIEVKVYSDLLPSIKSWLHLIEE